MAYEQWNTVDRYITDLFVQSDPALDAALAASNAAGLPQINVAPNQGKLLMLLAQTCRARSILEIGTLGGYSTIWLARALPSDGHLVTLEANSQYAEIAAANLKNAGAAGIVELRVGRAQETLPQLVSEGSGPFDLIFIDSADPGVQGMRQFMDLVAADHRVSATAIQTVGSKGYDGFALAVVTANL